MNEIIKKNGITYGVLLGVFSILITTIIYTVDLQLFTNMWLGMITMVIYIIIGATLVSRTKKQLGGIISFKEAFTVYFIAAIIGSTLSVLFNIVLFNYVDPAAKDTIRELTIKYSVEMLQKFGTPASTINESVDQMQKTDNYSPSNLLLGLVFSFAFSALFGLVLALIFKSKSPQNN